MTFDAETEPVAIPFEIQDLFGTLEPPGRRLDIIQRIYGNVAVVDMGYKAENPDHNCCYVWQGSSSGKETTARNGRGHSYPRMTLNGQTVAVHRVVWTHFEGYIPSKKQVDHRCSTRMCVRYEHLRMATQKQNCLFRDQKNGVVRKKRRRRRK